MDETTLQSLTSMLWPDGDSRTGQQVYWLLDGARDPAIAGLVMASALEYACLFAGELHPRLQAAAPYLVHLTPASAMAHALLQKGWGKAWGILALAAPDVTLTAQRLHFKKFLRVKTEQGKELAFRFYDPRVLNVYLPTCSADEFHTLLGPLAHLMAEIDDGHAIRVFELDGDGVRGRDTVLSPPLV